MEIQAPEKKENPIPDKKETPVPEKKHTNHRYLDLIEQTYDFPQEGFRVVDNYLYFNDVHLKELIDKYGTPLRISYLPKISSQIQKAKNLFSNAFKKHDYKGSYTYCYCSKSSHFSYIIEEALKNDIHLETSSEFDIDLILKLFEKGKIGQDVNVICNGFKTKDYAKKISDLINKGFKNVIPIIDNKEELDIYIKWVKEETVNVGIRIAAEEEPQFDFYTSRLGIRYDDIVEYYQHKIAPNPKIKLKMLHFFINSGIKDNAYYWNELNKGMAVYCELKKVDPDLSCFNVGGGYPIRNSLGFNFDYGYITDTLVGQIKKACDNADVPHPDIFTEFGTFTVGESGAILYKVLSQKKQNDSETWYMIDSSFITTLPDTWGIGQKFLVLPVNKWQNKYKRTFLGGLTCDSHDFYTREAHINQVYLPKLEGPEPLYIGFFHIGAYQESLSGFGGIKHCLIPAPKHLLLNKDENGNLTHRIFSEQQTPEEMLKILGY